MQAICPYDIKQINWKQAREKLAELQDHDHQIDWSDGNEFPWWVWLANTGQIRDLANEGIYNVHLEKAGGSRWVAVHSVRGWYYISPDPKDGKMIVTGPPRLYRGCECEYADAK